MEAASERDAGLVSKYGEDVRMKSVVEASATFSETRAVHHVKAKVKEVYSRRTKVLGLFAW